MGPIAIETMSLRSAAETPDPRRAEAEQVAARFEAMFVKTLVGSLRQTASIGGGGGMFGSDPGADTYADWFDQNLADQIAGTSRIGIREVLLADFERHGDLPRRLADAQAAAGTATAAANRTQLISARAAGLGGTDVVL